MKNIKVLVLLIGIISSVSSMAKCNKQYSQYTKSKAVASALTTTGTPTTGYAALGAFVVGGWGGSMPILILGMGLTTATPIIFGKGVSNSIVSLSLSSVNSLLKESEVGMGFTLTEVTDELSEDLDRNITEEEVAKLVNFGNQSELFCQNKNSPFAKTDNID